MRKDLHEANRLSWNAATQAHNSHKIDQAGFLRRGGSTLFAEELALLGDVRGLRIAHLQCNAGQDSLSLAALGALVTGVDISDEAIAFARRLSTDSGIAANFTRADIYDWLEREAAENPASYDIAFSSYGFLCWLSDLTVWAKGIHAILKPGGRFAGSGISSLRHVFRSGLGTGLRLRRWKPDPGRRWRQRLCGAFRRRAGLRPALPEENRPFPPIRIRLTNSIMVWGKR